MTDLAAFDDGVTPRIAPGAYPVPAGRGRWRVTLHNRQWAAQIWSQNLIAELVDAGGRQLDQAWNASAQFAFTIDGHSAEAALVVELATDIIAWRWDDLSGTDVAMFRGPVGQSQDQISDDDATVTFTCHDYYSMLGRRYLTQTLNFAQTEQDLLVGQIIQSASAVSSSSGTSFAPGSYLPVGWAMTNPDGTARSIYTGQPRDRTYTPNTQIQQILDDLAAVQNGYDWDIRPGARATGGSQDIYRIFYPNQGVARTDMVLEYGSTVASLTRAVSSQDYANYVRVLGNNGSSDPTAPQLFAEAWNSDSNNISVNPVGLWMSTDNAADVTIQSTLNDQAAGDLNLAGLIVPSYNLTLRPGAYSWGYPNMGDTVPLIIRKGRLNVNTTIRVLGISFAISDDGAEDVTLTVGRPAVKYLDTTSQAARDIDALTRR